MTEGEQIMALGEIAAELAEARKRLVCLNGKADSYRQQLNTGLAILNTANTGGRVLTEPSSDRFPTLENVKEVTSQIQDTTARIAELEKRLTQAGVIGSS